MVNEIVLVGRVAKPLELKVTENGKKTANLLLAVPRNYRNINGEYDTDFLDCTLWSNVAENTTEYCKTGDIVGLKGRVQSRIIEQPDGTKRKKIEIIGDRITFLGSTSSSKNKEKEETEVAEEDSNTTVKSKKDKKNN